jgi:hypothetical protein
LPGVRSRSAKLLIWLLICQLGLSFTILVYLVTESPSHAFSVATAFLVNFFVLATTFWSMAVTMTISFVIVQRNWLLERLNTRVSLVAGLGTSGNYRMLRFHGLVWTFSAIFSIIPLAAGAYDGFSEDWYWFQSNVRSHWIGASCYYFPLGAGKSSSQTKS